MTSDNQINILLLGRTGCGKSALGNTILGRRAFDSGMTSTSETTRVSVESTELNGRRLTVVDTPGMLDSRIILDEAGLKRLAGWLEEAVKAIPSGFHALLLVVRFGLRFTQEDEQSTQLLKSVLGDDVLRSHTVLVFSGGDAFRREHKSDGWDFNSWLREREALSVVRKLVDECQGRAALIDNRSPDGAARESQLSQLLAQVDKLQAKGERPTYTIGDFQLHEKSRQKLFVAAQEPEICLEVIKAVTKMSDKFRDTMAYQPARQVEDLKKLVEICRDFEADLKKKDRGTGALENVLMMVALTHKSFSDALSTQLRALGRSRQEDLRSASREKQGSTGVRARQSWQDWGRSFFEKRSETETAQVSPVADRPGVLQWLFGRWLTSPGTE